jgi:hypothetical protein
LVLSPTTRMTYLGLRVDTSDLTIQPTSACIQHLIQLASIVHIASQQDLHRIAGYASWLCYAMGWPLFLANLLR